MTFRDLSVRGRETELTPVNAKIILRAIGEGTPIKYAMGGAGLSEKTFYHWLREAKKKDARPHHLEFLANVDKARAKAITKFKNLVVKGAKSNWKAAAYMLSILDRETFGTERDELKSLKALIEKLLAGETAK